MRTSNLNMSMHLGEFEVKAVDFKREDFAILYLDIKRDGNLAGALTLFLENIAEANLLKHVFEVIQAMRREATEQKEAAK